MAMGESEKSTDKVVSKLTKLCGDEWQPWVQYATDWIAIHEPRTKARLNALRHFFETYLMERAPYAHNIIAFFEGHAGHKVSSDEFVETMRDNGVNSSRVLSAYANTAVAFVDFVIEQYDSAGRRCGNRVISNPLVSFGKLEKYTTDVTVSWLTRRYGPGWQQWEQLASEWIANQDASPKSKLNALGHFFESYLVERAPYAQDIRAFFEGHAGHKVSYEEFVEAVELKGLAAQKVRRVHRGSVVAFVDFVVKKYNSTEHDHRIPIISNPLVPSSKIQTYTADATVSWLTRSHGQDWRQWEQYAAAWVATQEENTRTKLIVLGYFFETYLVSSAPYAKDVMAFFVGHAGHKVSTQEFVDSIKAGGVKSRSALRKYRKLIAAFVDFVIEHYRHDKTSRLPELSNPFAPIKERQGYTTDGTLSWLTLEHGDGWQQWQRYATAWIATQNGEIASRLNALKHFFQSYLVESAQYAQDVWAFFEGQAGHQASSKEFIEALQAKGVKSRQSQLSRLNKVIAFLDFVIEQNDFAGEGSGVSLVSNPLVPLGRAQGYSSDTTLSWLTRLHGQGWQQWEQYAADWIANQQLNVKTRLNALRHFFENYLLQHAPYAEDVAAFFEGRAGHKVSSQELVEAMRSKGVKSSKAENTFRNMIVDFVDFVINQHFTDEVEIEPTKVSNPLSSGRRSQGFTSDTSLSWLTRLYGPGWRQWEQYAAEWIAIQDGGITAKLGALRQFFVFYLMEHAPYAKDVVSLFEGQAGHKASSEELVEAIQSKSAKGTSRLNACVNVVVEFIDHVIKQHFSVAEDNGFMSPLGTNPFDRINSRASWTETVRNPLPFRYIKQLREILCPYGPSAEYDHGEESSTQGAPWINRHFRDWQWAHENVAYQWFEVDPHVIDRDDPDCVWRTKEVHRPPQKTTIYQIWSPVAAMALFVKLHLPLRTYQVRMLDSGEADTWRYEEGVWLGNPNLFAYVDKKRPYARGVFRRIYDTVTETYTTGLYVTTNKTADRNKDEVDRGYPIPWHHEELLYWLEKLRNWQERYNPISSPTSAVTLERKHIGHTKAPATLEAMGEYCFLFRDASARSIDDRRKPIQDLPLGLSWYRLLSQLENNIASAGQTLADGTTLKLVEDYPDNTSVAHRRKTLFPLHSLRVSLITAYTMDTPMPLPVVQKLLAGHSGLVMTIGYTKITPSVMAEKMDEAHSKLDQNSESGIRAFLKDAELSQIRAHTAYTSEESVRAAIANRNPIGWEHRSEGLCLVGGNTVRSDELSTVGGCWNGGPIIKERENAHHRVYGPVPHGPENCIRCRWFITDASYLPALVARFNQISYKAYQAANLAVKIEGKLEVLRDEQYFAQEEDIPFTKQSQLQELSRRFERQIVEADEYAKDFVACFQLIQRLMYIENQRAAKDKGQKLIAVGSQEDLKASIRFIETESELLHLSLLCDDAELYPDLEDELRKTPAIEKRTRQLSRMMTLFGYEPVLMDMDEEAQLIVGNAVMRKMAQIADASDKLEGYRKATSYIDTRQYLEDSGLLESGLSELKAVSPITLSSLAKQIPEYEASQ